MTTPINRDAAPCGPRTPEPMPLILGCAMPPHFARAPQQRNIKTTVEPAFGPAPAGDSDVEPWYGTNWTHAAFLARQAMEQAFAAQRGDDA